jgi:hypothetical protein
MIKAFYQQKGKKRKGDPPDIGEPGVFVRDRDPDVVTEHRTYGYEADRLSGESFVSFWKNLFHQFLYP